MPRKAAVGSGRQTPRPATKKATSKADLQRLLDAARHYAQAYDQVEQKSRISSGNSVSAFARFQEAQVELNLAALDLFAGQSRLRKP